jgi:DNA-binding transcriptional regulator YdaS (Cro superfamily)
MLSMTAWQRQPLRPEQSLLPVLVNIVAVVGSVSAIARGLGIARATVYSWDKVPKKYVFKLEKLQRDHVKLMKRRVVTRHEIRPDLYPHPKEGK